MSEFVENYVDEVLAVAEGKKDHKSSEGGAYTSAYGVTEVARKKYPKQEGETPRDYAVRVAGEYAKQAERALGSDVWEKMPEHMKLVALDVQYNSSINSNEKFKADLKEKDYVGAIKNTLDIISANDPKTKTKGTLPGLAKRRAAIYNIAAREMGIPEISKVQTSETKNGKVLTKYLTNQDNTVFEIKTNRLHSDGSYGSLQPDVYGYEIKKDPANRTHVVARGDTLTNIAARNKTTVPVLRQLNGLGPKEDTIKIGEQLKLPEPVKTSSVDPFARPIDPMFANLFDDTVKNPFA